MKPQAAASFDVLTTLCKSLLCSFQLCGRLLRCAIRFPVKRFGGHAMQNEIAKSFVEVQEQLSAV